MREMIAYKGNCPMEVQACTEPGTLSYKALLIRFQNRGATLITYDGEVVYEAELPDAMGKRAAFVSEVVQLYESGLQRTAINITAKHPMPALTSSLIWRERGWR